MSNAPDPAAGLAAVRSALAEAISADRAAGSGWKAAREVLRGLADAATPGAVPVASWLDLIRRVAAAPQSSARRAFAVLVLDALAVPGLLPASPSQARLEREVCALLEAALPGALHRAGYPFGAEPDARRRCLAALPATIEEHLRPLEPTFPFWLTGRRV